MIPLTSESIEARLRNFRQDPFTGVDAVNQAWEVSYMQRSLLRGSVRRFALAGAALLAGGSIVAGHGARIRRDGRHCFD